MKRPNEHQRIIDDLHIWAGFYHDKTEGGYPKASNFVNERVQSSARSSADYVEIPPETKRLHDCIMKLAPQFVAIIRMHYKDRATSTNKAAKLRAEYPSLSLPVYCLRLAWAHEQLTFSMYG
jgi:hypothetical protein